MPMHGEEEAGTVVSLVRLTNESWGDHVLVFDSEDVETFENPRDTVVVGERNGYEERRFADTSHLLLHFKAGKHARWESAE